MTHRHTIRRVTLEVLTAGTEEARQLQDGLGDLFRRRLIGVLDRHLTAVGGPGLDLIDRLELDLGWIDPADLENEMTARLETQLSAALGRALHEARLSANAMTTVTGTDVTDIPPAAAPALALIGQFARSGGLPSWSDSRSRRLLEEAVESARRNAPAALAELLRGLAGTDRPLDRLASHLDDTGLAALLATIVAGGGRAGVDAAIPGELLRLLEHSAAVAGIGRTRLRSLLWRETLRAVCLPSGGDESPAPWHRVLTALALAPECGTTLAALVSDLPYALRHQGKPASPAILAIVAGLVMRVPPALPGELELAKGAPAGGIAAGIADAEITDAGIADAGQETLDSLFVRLRDRLTEAGDPAAPFPPLSDLLAPLVELLRPLAGRLTPDRQRGCAAALTALLRLDADMRVAVPTSMPAAVLAAVRELVRPFLQAGLVTGAALAQALAGIERRGAADRLAAERHRAEAGTTTGTESLDDLATGEANGPDDAPDVLYLENAGLCLLWPFLGHFFAHLGLMDVDRAFLDEPARHRAVFLLHHVATGATEAPEYQLTLNKVLCGMPLDLLPGSGDPPTEAEAEETEKLLGALAAHVADLSALSVEDLREGFLLRPGALSTRDGAWLLRVERRACDSALDPPPWPMEWISLPWMSAPIRVEW